ncbi:hypothetical protein JTB14_007716 [Gonioctena quinquepunctata]|nr:hypothetical protein JTB14_007716 [Gonioctena quinquepunctata]
MQYLEKTDEHAVDDLDGNKGPGPDGIPGFFEAWDISSSSTMEECLDLNKPSTICYNYWKMITMEDSRMMTFQSGELTSTMFQKLFEQKKASRFCDVNLFVNNKILKAHRNVLACSSPYFDSILKHHKAIREQLTISCLDSEIFNTILNFMYTGEITIGHSNVEELLKLADHFIPHQNNCLFTYFLTQRFKLKHLGNIVENWIASHIDEICKGKEILGLNHNELSEFFKNKNFLLTTSKALNLLSQWVQADIRKKGKEV